jgi:hypothetical protein
MIAKIAEALPHDIALVEYRDAEKTISEISNVLKDRREGSDDMKGVSIFLMVMGLQRFRMLREEEDFGLASSASGGKSPAACFADILTDGPAEGIYSIVWCDTLSNLNRAVGRRLLREFESRVLFQMGATDSSELADTPAASRLGLYGALLFTQHDGAIEKFRPYARPDAAFIDELAGLVRKRMPAMEGRQG